VSSADPLAELERWLEELARRFERFFAKDPHVPVPPERERAALERRLRDISRRDASSVAEQFRREQLLHRFSSLNLLWQRMLREREEARGVASAAARAANVKPPPPVAEKKDDYRAVFDTYLAAQRRAGQTAAVGYDRFCQALEQQRRQLVERGAHVEGFEVVEDGSGVKVRARVRRGRQA
jgi:hypothetical protein